MVDILEPGPDLEDVAAAELPAYAAVVPDLLAVPSDHEVERQPAEQSEPVREDVGDPPEDRDDPARLVRFEQLVALWVADVPVAAEQRAREVLLEQAQLVVGAGGRDADPVFVR